MFKNIFLFELKYRKARAANYIYFAIMFLLCFLAVTTDVVQIGGAVGQVKENAPIVIGQMIAIMGFFMTLISSAIMGVAVLRDFEHNTEAILFSTPIKKFHYLMGRFWGSYVVLLLVAASLPIAFMLGDLWPMREADRLLPFNLATYWQPYFIFVVPNMFFTGAIFFASGALSRKSIVIYTQGILLLVLYIGTSSLLRDLEQKEIAALCDPFGVRAFSFYTQYWTPGERNSLQIPLDGYILYNRLLWMGVGIVILIINHFAFSFNVVRSSVFRPRAVKDEALRIKPEETKIPVAQQFANLSTHIGQLVKLTLFYFKMVFKEIPFIAIVISGILLLFVNAINLNELFGTSSYPTTYTILGLLSGFNLFFLIIAVLYSGELVWKERAVNLNLIIDAMPMPDFIALISKFLGMLLVYIVLIAGLIVAGMLVQISYGYYNFELGIYIGTLYTETLAFLVLYTMLSMFIHVMVNNKFLGFAVAVAFFILVSFFGQIGLEHPLFQFGSGSLGTYSDMNVYGHFVTPFSWFQVYWFAFVVLLFGIAVVFSSRGSEDVISMRWKAGKLRLSKQLVTLIVCAVAVFLSSGFYIYYNTNVVNRYTNKDGREGLQVDYEKTLKKYEFIAQLRITDVNLKVDLYPSKRDYSAEGYFILKNKTNEPISDIHIQENALNYIKTEKLEFNRKFGVKEKFDRFKYTIYQLAEPLQPGDSVQMNFKTSFVTNGFTDNNASTTSVIYNGTFFNNTYLPSLGYNENYEMSDDNDRKEKKLPEKERMMERNDPRGLSQSLFGDDADHVRFEIVLSTDKDQLAIAPGYLQKSWEEKDRKYFQYKMDAPMCNFFSIISARYEVKRDKWNDVNLEIYYHKGHEYNLDKMMEGMKDALNYYTKHFSPYQYRQVRIMEFPRYATFAQSFANTIPFSEGIGFIAKIDDPDKDIDYVYYVTAHEVAHQWWGHQVMEAGVKGNAMLSESMSQYSALMVLKHKFTPEIIERYLKYELDRYLSGRAGERKKEQPLELVEGQGYIHYQKASLIFFALQDYISEDSVNAAFRRFNQTWRFKDAPYPTSADLLKEIRKVTPDSLQYLIKDMFETITLFENKTDSAFYKEKSKNEFEVTVYASAEKLRADSTGIETPIAINDWIDVGVYGKNKAGKDSLLYLKKHKITQKQNQFKILVKAKPRKAGIDPLHKLIDRHSNDNTKGLVAKR
ncbi:MAG: aminopeptidase [Bacteroidetes bacterium]|nr:aminopeptidase [Bacteroidota bacterium]